ncbi:MAG: hypothetical protein KF784_07915 [Fimbriimonadaceae bacterium]|nr:hypothetical protein [Fimbriimonadaceae bacterium]
MTIRHSDLYRLVFAICLLFVSVTAVAQFDGQSSRGGRDSGSSSQDKELKELLESAPPILRKMMERAQKNTYSGERKTEFRRRSEWISHTEYILRNGSRMRITFPRDSKFAGQVIAEDGKTRHQYFPDRNEIEVAPARYDELTERLYGMLKAIKSGSVDVSTGDGGTVAGQKTELVEVSDKKGNPLQRFWIEPKTGILLKREFYNQVGSVDGRFEFVRIDLSPRFNPRDIFPIRRQGAKYLSLEDVSRRLMKENGFDQAFLPASEGFALQSVRVMQHDDQKALFQAYRHKEKVVTFFQVLGSVEMEKLKRMAPKEVRIHTWTQGSKSFVIIGQFSDREFERWENKVKNPEA